MKQTIILSAELSHLSRAVNSKRTVDLRNWLNRNNYTFKEATGVYKGVKENAFAVEVSLFSQTFDLLEIAFVRLGQESVLKVYDDKKTARLVFANFNSISLNWFKGVLAEDHVIIENQAFTGLPAAPRVSNFPVAYSVA